MVINSDSAIIRDMIGGMVWEHKEGLTPALSYLPMPEGRLVKQDTSYRYEYFYTDHQGNTRVSWTPVEASQNQHLLTMEAGADEEGDYPKFKNVTTFRDGNQALSGASSAKVTNATGPYISIPVMKGDTIDASVYYYYDDQSTSSSSQQMLTSEQETGGSGNEFTFTAPLFTTTPRIPGTGDNQAAGGGVRFNLAALYPIGKALFGNKKESTSNLSISEGTLSTAPAAYLELLLYDKDSALVSSQAVPVGSSTFWAQIDGTLTASDNGYVVVQLRSQDTQDVWFDDLQIDHRKPDRAVVLQENHYYPFGLQMEGVAVNTALPTDPNRKLYNAGSDWQKETGFYSTQYREYDPALGRFHAIDPLASKFATWTPYMYGYNDPVNANDPDGAQSVRKGSVAEQVQDRNRNGKIFESLDPGGRQAWLLPERLGAWRETQYANGSGNYENISIESAVNTLLKSKLGGTYRPGSGFTYFKSDYEVAFAGISYNIEHGTFHTTELARSLRKLGESFAEAYHTPESSN
ncbi:RHS repeat-associated core domain-containing protein [Roseivirga sp. BDSF3-8]|uniref:RHS repeat-associated core domain-containing protein n=1 Tax=Roseivirga sp. BDSF3-8 TaxID=3241598 RepID=UPI003532328E